MSLLQEPTDEGACIDGFGTLLVAVENQKSITSNGREFAIAIARAQASSF